MSNHTEEELLEKLVSKAIKRTEVIVDQKIKSHEIRVGIISGIIGLLFVFGIFHSIWLMKVAIL